MKSIHRKSQRGFTLIETLVAVIITMVGIFGFIKMQALALSAGKTSNSRSIVALQTSSLAAAIQGNPSFWAAGLAPASFTTAGSTITDGTSTLTNTQPTCYVASTPASAQCTPAQIASYDVKAWANSMNAVVPNYTSTIACTTLTTAAIECSITVNWVEKFVSSNAATVSNSAATGGNRSYSLHIVTRNGD